MSIDSLGGAAGINLQNLQSMDLETALMMVQSERTKLLDSQLQTQIQEVQNRNEMVSKLNNVVNALNASIGQISGTGPNDVASAWPSERAGNAEVPLNDAIAAAGITDLGFTAGAGVRHVIGADGKPTSATQIVRNNPAIMSAPSTPRSQLEAAVTKVKGMIDALGNTQQMDMLRLQSLSNKRNEAFDVMTNFVKKMQESRSSIIGNMR
ncbi:hypothetical protein FXN63_22360 [Pigmentiphaga aceris]|uniref:Secreted protein n=1 Tax=Pigmentiphaga aceris TaxID=1940612 RepID=A0A5C0B4S3_9BURK|nr:hypothetical protein [Pigmentiphaga aceris]QEI08270.1 hypothetical protein FXN63_22360 [Pigmentiphaga aceris]